MEPGFLKPGNRTARRRPTASTRYFNGARLPEARKPAHLRRPVRHRRHTSMEPSFLKPGNARNSSASTARWIHFNGARLPEARKHAAVSVERESLSSWNHFNGARLPEARKQGRTVFAAGLGMLTSMEPGFLKPGNLSVLRLQFTRAPELQWSQAS